MHEASGHLRLAHSLQRRGLPDSVSTPVDHTSVLQPPDDLHGANPDMGLTAGRLQSPLSLDYLVDGWTVEKRNRILDTGTFDYHPVSSQSPRRETAPLPRPNERPYPHRAASEPPTLQSPMEKYPSSSLSTAGEPMKYVGPHVNSPRVDTLARSPPSGVQESMLPSDLSSTPPLSNQTAASWSPSASPLQKTRAIPSSPPSRASATEVIQGLLDRNVPDHILASALEVLNKQGGY